MKFNLNFISQIEKADRYTLYFLRYHTMADADFWFWTQYLTNQRNGMDSISVQHTHHLTSSCQDNTDTYYITYTPL